MVLKTFNLDEGAYSKFSGYCKENGLSMSRQVNIFIMAQIEEEPEVKEEYLRKLDVISRGKFIRVGTFEDFENRFG